MLISIGQGSDHGFDTPLGLLSDCHRRIERFLSVLVTIAEVHRGAALPAADRAALEAALHYFRNAAPRHAADEEDSLFPRLRSLDHPLAQEACAALDRLEADHDVADHHHDAVDGLGRRWLSDGMLIPSEADTLREHLGALQALYRDHIAVEDQRLFPVAGRVLTKEELEAVGREMAARRGVAFLPPPGLG